MEKPVSISTSNLALNRDKELCKKYGLTYDSSHNILSQLEDLRLGSDCDESVTATSSLGSQEEEEPERLLGDSNRSLLLEEEVSQIELFFQSHKTYVYVCNCLANLYFSERDFATKWELARTGVPLILLDKGETRQRSKRLLKIALAERGTGFPLWSDTIDNLSNYNAKGTFHTLYLSTDHSKKLGLCFDNVSASQEFHCEVTRLTADPLNISLSVPKSKKKLPKKKKPGKLPRKSEISKPCLFQHVTSVAIDDKQKLYSLAALVPTALD